MNTRRLALAGVLVALGVVVGVVGLVWTLRGLFSVEASVPVDGSAHAVGVGAGEHVVWVGTSTPQPTCSVAADGVPLRLHPVEGELTRGTGTESWRAQWWFEAPGDAVTLTCDGATDAVEIGPRLRPLHLAGTLLAVLGTAGILVLVGGVLLVVTVVQGIAAQSRPART